MQDMRSASPSEERMYRFDTRSAVKNAAMQSIRPMMINSSVRTIYVSERRAVSSPVSPPSFLVLLLPLAIALS